MFDSQTQARINQSCTEAFVNYLNASGAAYQAMAHQMLRAWGQSVDAFVESAQSGASPSNRAVQRYGDPRTSPGLGGAACMMPWAAVPNAMMQANPMAAFNPFGVPYGMFSPFAPWFDMLKPMQSQAWPMAVGMISVGVPEQIAWPTARGNAAAMDAFNVAASSLEKAFAEYQKTGAARDMTTRAPPPAARVERMDGPAANPFTLAFAITPFNPGFLIDFFAPFSKR